MRSPRLTVGAVNARTGTMRYFDSRHEALGIDHLLASGALPPAFGAVRIDGEPYWDGGIYSNTPIEAVLDDQPRRNSTIFTVQLWNASGEEPESIWDVMAQQKEIEYSSRADSHIARQQQLHRLRHVIAELERRLPREMRRDDAVDRLCAYGCGTVMHVIRLLAPRLAHDDQTKDIDFTAESIAARWQAGLDDTRKALAAAPWRAPVDPLQGVAVHDVSARGPSPALPKGRP
jgi:NTE family protein